MTKLMPDTLCAYDGLSRHYWQQADYSSAESEHKLLISGAVIGLFEHPISGRDI